jgi:hypothetical protein
MKIYLWLRYLRSHPVAMPVMRNGTFCTTIVRKKAREPVAHWHAITSGRVTSLPVRAASDDVNSGSTTTLHYHLNTRGSLGRVCACATGRCVIFALVGPFHRKWRHQTSGRACALAYFPGEPLRVKFDLISRNIRLHMRAHHAFQGNPEGVTWRLMTSLPMKRPH